MLCKAVCYIREKYVLLLRRCGTEYLQTVPKLVFFSSMVLQIRQNVSAVIDAKLLFMVHHFTVCALTVQPLELIHEQSICGYVPSDKTQMFSWYVCQT